MALFTNIMMVTNSKGHALVHGLTASWLESRQSEEAESRQLLPSQGSAFRRMPKHAGIVPRARSSLEVPHPLATFKAGAVHQKTKSAIKP